MQQKGRLFMKLLQTMLTCGKKSMVLVRLLDSLLVPDF